MASPLSPHPLNTKTTVHAGESPYYTTNINTGNTDSQVAYDVGFALIVLLFIIIVIFASYMCNHTSRSPPPLPTAADSDTDDDFHSIMLSDGTLEGDILSKFPTIVYAEMTVIKPRKGSGNCDSGCPVCLMDYESTDDVRLLPECGHLFHVSCVDKWLKVRFSCPMCRKSPLPTSVKLT